MNISVVIIVLSFIFLFLSSLTYLTASLETCFDAVCQMKEPVIRFPFRIENRQPSTCGYPGFRVSCTKQGQTLLKLPYSGEFTIQGINYATQQLWINDPNNCLPKSILSFNLSGSPFEAVYYQEFTFFNCSFNLEYLAYRYNSINCLSDSPNYTVFATSSPSAFDYLSSVCNLVKTVKVPVQLPFHHRELYSDLNDDLRLSWASPPCGRCESHGGRCGLKINSSFEVACSNISSKGISRGARYAIAIGIGVPAVLCFFGMLSCFCDKFRFWIGRTRGWAWAHETVPDFQPLTTVILGLDGPTIESYPKIVLDESEPLLRPNDNTCPICLSEYRPKEMVKSIPECLHYFHAQCIDEWLQLNASCPICRTSPRKLPQPLDPSSL